MVSKPYVPNRGDFVWLQLDPRVGHEQSGRRPALVLSRRLLAEKTGLMVICPITSKPKGMPYEIAVTSTRITGAILALHVRSVDYVAWETAFIATAPASVLAEATQKAGLLIGG